AGPEGDQGGGGRTRQPPRRRAGRADPVLHRPGRRARPRRRGGPAALPRPRAGAGAPHPQRARRHRRRPAQAQAGGRLVLPGLRGGGRAPAAALPVRRRRALGVGAGVVPGAVRRRRARLHSDRPHLVVLRAAPAPRRRHRRRADVRPRPRDRRNDPMTGPPRTRRRRRAPRSAWQFPLLTDWGMRPDHQKRLVLIVSAIGLAGLAAALVIAVASLGTYTPEARTG